MKISLKPKATKRVVFPYRKVIMVGGVRAYGHLYPDGSVRVFSGGEYIEGTNHLTPAQLARVTKTLKTNFIKSYGVTLEVYQAVQEVK